MRKFFSNFCSSHTRPCAHELIHSQPWLMAFTSSLLKIFPVETVPVLCSGQSVQLTMHCAGDNDNEFDIVGYSNAISTSPSSGAMVCTGEYKRMYEHLYHSKCFSEKRQMLSQCFAMDQIESGVRGKGYLTDGMVIFTVRLVGEDRQIYTPRVMDIELFMLLLIYIHGDLTEADMNELIRITNRDGKEYVTSDEVDGLIEEIVDCSVGNDKKSSDQIIHTDKTSPRHRHKKCLFTDDEYNDHVEILKRDYARSCGVAYLDAITLLSVSQATHETHFC